MLGDEKGVTGVRIRHAETGATDRLDVHGLFIAIGHTPNTAIFDEAIETLRDDGLISALLEEYFGADPGDIPVVEV